MTLPYLSVAQDIIDIVAALMSVGGGSELSVVEVETLTFDASGRLLAALNEAFIKLLEFAHDADRRARNPLLDRRMRAELGQCLDKIARLSDVVGEIGRANSPALRLAAG